MGVTRGFDAALVISSTSAAASSSEVSLVTEKSRSYGSSVSPFGPETYAMLVGGLVAAVAVGSVFDGGF